jgi:hypothetical protein
LGIVAHYVAADGTLQDLPIALPQLTGAHSSKRIAKVVVITLQAFKITTYRVSYFILNNATNNNATVAAIARKLEFKFNAVYCRLRYSPYILNLIRQILL